MDKTSLTLGWLVGRQIAGMRRTQEKPPILPHATYKWKVVDNSLVSIGENDNPLTPLAGGIVDGLFKNARYQLATPFNLLHDKDWAVEWKARGTWDNASGSGMVKLWSESGERQEEGIDAICMRHQTRSISIVRYQSGGHVHYGVKLKDYGLDFVDNQVYRLQNHVAEDGTNMVWLYVDGVKVAPMRHEFKASENVGLSDWVAGKDFSFGYMGVPSYILNDGIVDDISVWESGYSQTSEPIAYLYNGVQLPPLPEWDKETYPYAFLYIEETDFEQWIFRGASLVITKTPAHIRYRDDNVNLPIMSWELPSMRCCADYNYDADNKVWVITDDWGEFIIDSQYKEIAGTVGYFQLWSNYDMYDTNENLYLEASDPIPVYE